MTNCTVSPAEDYTKRRHVFRLTTASQSELLLQTECQEDMAKWIGVVSGGSSIGSGTGSGQNVSPVAAHKGLMKLTTPFRNRSPTGQSPVNKTRKPSQAKVPASPPKSKTWKGRVAKQLRRIQAGAGSPVSPTAPISYPEGATIGVPLELCPKSMNNEYVPLIVELCTRIVEDRGLEIIGIYRVPGNTAAVTSLTEAVNKGLNEALLDQDQRWTDVNVISSLLKLFFRRLPDCLLTNELYPSFIQADRIDDPKLRVFSIRKLVQDLPEHHLHTLRHLIKHLQLVVEHSSINKMEAKNLAIVFGPTLVRAADDNMVTLVTDMSSQCRIVETLIHHADWCFSEDSLDRLIIRDERQSSISVDSESAIPNQTLLLDNVHKLEGMKGEVSRRDIVSSIITAANRKMLKTKSRKQVTSSGDEIVQLEDTASSSMTSAGTIEDNRSVAGAIASGVRESVIFSGSLLQSSLSQEDKDEEKLEDKPSNLSPQLCKQPTTEEGTIITYTGLSETTQERIRRFELETKAMLQRDKKLNPKEWIKPTAPTAISTKIAGGEERKRSEGSSPLARWRQITCPEQQNNSTTQKRVVKSGSLDSLSDHINIAASHHLHNNNNNSVGGGDLVSSLTLTFDAKLKSLGLLSPVMKNLPETLPSDNDSAAFRDPSLHRSFTSPNLEEKIKEKKDEINEKEEVEKDDEKENCFLLSASSGAVKLKRSESLNKRDSDKKETSGRHLRRTESLNKRESSLESRLKRSDSLTKTEKTDLNLSKRRAALEAASKKMKRKTGGGSDRSIKRRHTVGGTKDFDKSNYWLDNREREVAQKKDDNTKIERRTSSPDLLADTWRRQGPPLLVVLRPQSLLVAAEPLESHI
ncbi:hypothetical protein O3M35_012126 [Rhynocoris fuscipes]|uniref:Rho GTPase-activating protein 21 n=1 Tax=Rhynocoris fuscipes TaxID=488301 RepID=A0AAW1CSD6_9HEMI